MFADLADDEDDDWSARGATIRPAACSGTASAPQDVLPPSLSRSRSRSLSDREPESGSEGTRDRGSRASFVCDVEDGFTERCRRAEERHRQEMRGWVPAWGAADRAYLFEIRALATRQY